MKNNKGAVSVLLLLILAVMITVIGAAGEVCSMAVAKAYAQRMNYMACKSVLAEYNSYLFEDYGLLGFEGGKDEIKDLVKNYNSMMKRVDDSSDEEIVFFDVMVQDLSINCTGRNLCEKSVFMEQIRELMKLKAIETGAEKLIDVIQGDMDIGDEVNKAKAGYDQQQEAEGNGDNNKVEIGEKIYDPEEKDSDRILRSRMVIEALPSNAEETGDDKGIEKYDLGEEEALMKLGEDSSGFLKKFYGSVSAGTDKFLLIDYADEFFKNAVKEPERYKDTFFDNEMEYILKGNLSDNKNLSLVKKDLFLLRTALNLAHIYSDPAKTQIVLEAAASTGSGPYGAALQFVFAAAWAGVEAKEDMERLFAGGEVPFIKEKQDWKTDIESVFSGTEMISVDYAGGRGLDYTEYLKLLLIASGKEKLMERIMDLIQINMKGRYDIRFDLRNHITGFEVSADYERKAFLPEVLPVIVEEDLMHIEEVFSY